jgi:WD40 repeat protein
MALKRAAVRPRTRIPKPNRIVARRGRYQLAVRREDYSVDPARVELNASQYESERFLTGHLGSLGTQSYSRRREGGSTGETLGQPEDRPTRMQTGRCQHTLEGHSDWVTSVVFSPDGSRVDQSRMTTRCGVWYVQQATCTQTTACQANTAKLFTQNIL